MPSLSEAYRGHPVDVVHHHKHPDLKSLHELPDSYAWSTHHLEQLQPTTDHHHHHHSNNNNNNLIHSVPAIDLSDPNASNLIGHACKTWGAFQVLNHGVPLTLLDDIQRTGQALFSLPSHQKLKAARSPDGVSGYGLARISSFFPKLMWSEGFTILGSPLEHFRQLWPQDYAKYCEVVVRYDETMKRLAGKLMRLMLDPLGISMDDLNWAAGSEAPFHKDPCAALQLNSYPACPDPDRAMGLAPHTDSTLLTILYQNNISGLQVHREGTGWVTVAPIPGGLVVNVGDLFHILSNGLYPSVLHRVLVNRRRQRFSVAYLYGPPGNAEICPHAKVVGPARPALYRAVTWSEYLGEKAKHFNKALSSVQVCVPVGNNGLFDVSDTHHRSQNKSLQVG